VLTQPKPADTTPAKPSKPALDTMAIGQLMAAIRSGDIEKVAQRFPGMTPVQRGFFIGVIFSPGRTVGRPKAVWTEATIVGDTAKVPLEIRVPVTMTATGSTTVFPLKYGAVFALKGSKYVLVALLQR
jgi:hypothetical protein